MMCSVRAIGHLQTTTFPGEAHSVQMWDIRDQAMRVWDQDHVSCRSWATCSPRTIRLAMWTCSWVQQSYRVLHLRTLLPVHLLWRRPLLHRPSQRTLSPLAVPSRLAPALQPVLRSLGPTVSVQGLFFCGHLTERSIETILGKSGHGITKRCANWRNNQVFPPYDGRMDFSKSDACTPP